MAAVLLDTTVLIDPLRGWPETSARIRTATTREVCPGIASGTSSCPEGPAISWKATARFAAPSNDSSVVWCMRTPSLRNKSDRLRRATTASNRAFSAGASG